MSFINLLASDVWSEADIINRTESMIASEFPRARLDILTRKVQGQAMGYVLTESEQADLEAYQTLCYAAGAEADAARADMALLNEVLAYESWVSAEPPAEGVEPEPEPELSPEALALYELRNPVVVAPDEVVEVVA